MLVIFSQFSLFFATNRWSGRSTFLTPSPKTRTVREAGGRRLRRRRVRRLAIGVPLQDVFTFVARPWTLARLRDHSYALGLDLARKQYWTQTIGCGGFFCVVDGRNEAGDLFGSALAAGDFDGDGRDDLAIGHYGENSPAGFDSGAVSVLMGAPVVGLGDAGYRTIIQGADGFPGGPAQDGRYLGFALAAGDFDGDGRADLAIGAPREDVGALTNLGVEMISYGSSPAPFGRLRAGRERRPGVFAPLYWARERRLPARGGEAPPTLARARPAAGPPAPDLEPLLGPAWVESRSRRGPSWHPMWSACSAATSTDRLGVPRSRSSWPAKMVAPGPLAPWSPRITRVKARFDRPRPVRRARCHLEHFKDNEMMRPYRDISGGLPWSSWRGQDEPPSRGGLCSSAVADRRRGDSSGLERTRQSVIVQVGALIRNFAWVDARRPLASLCSGDGQVALAPSTARHAVGLDRGAEVGLGRGRSIMQGHQLAVLGGEGLQSFCMSKSCQAPSPVELAGGRRPMCLTATCRRRGRRWWRP